MTKIELLREQIRKHEFLYYILSTPEISDTEYDALIKQLEEMEKQDPSLITTDSPTQRVGNDLTKKFAKIPHSRPMLSISNVYSEDELINFDHRVKDALKEEPYEYIAELKIDGVAIALRYNDGILKQALTRGDGKIGDDVTANAKTIKSIPLKMHSLSFLPPHPPCEVRGEVYMDRNAFTKLNEELPSGEKFQNPRNAASGSLKLQNPQEVSRRGLKFLAHFVFGKEWEKEHHWNLITLRNLGFPIESHSNKCKDIQEVISYIKTMEEGRKTVGFDTDGVVVKVNFISQHEKIGYTTKAPKWAVAYKYKPETLCTKLIGVDCQVGRTGVLTPVARMEPIFVSGSTISNATLHNYEEVARMDLRQGDWVWIEKGGEIIPKITGVELSRRVGITEPFQPPKTCMVCGNPVIKSEDEVAIRCSNINCPAQIQAQIEHFVSRGAMNMEDIGPALIAQLLNVKLITNWDDLYKLTMEELMKLERMGKKSAENVLLAIEKSKNNIMNKVLFAMGIRHVGQGIADTLASHIKSIWDLKDMTIDELRKIPDTGEVVANSIHKWFCVPENIDRLLNIEKAGVKLNCKESLKEGCKLNGKSFCFTGVMSKPRSYYQNLVKKNGGKNISSVTKDLSCLVCNEDKGSTKFIKAQQLNIPIITEQEFLSLVVPVLSETQNLKPRVENISLF